MRTLKRTLALVLALAMAVTAFGAVTVSAATYPDTAGHWAEEVIDKWTGYGVIQGDGGYFRPDDSITRAEVAQVTQNVISYATTGVNSYSDVDASAWYADAVLKLSSAGVLTGNGDGTMTPDANMTREEAMTMLSRAYGLEPVNNMASITNYADYSSISDYATGFIGAMTAAGYVNGYPDGTIRPQDNIARGEFVKILDNMIKLYITGPGTYGPGYYGGIIMVKSGGVTIDGVIADGIVISPVVSGEVNLTGGTQVGGHVVNLSGNAVINDLGSDANVNDDDVSVVSPYYYNGGAGSGSTRRTYTVKFIVDGELYDTVTVRANNYVELPADPEKAGADFVGWYSTQALADRAGQSGLIDFGARRITSNLTVYAGFAPYGTSETPEPSGEPEVTQEPTAPTPVPGGTADKESETYNPESGSGVQLTITFTQEGGQISGVVDSKSGTSLTEGRDYSVKYNEDGSAVLEFTPDYLKNLPPGTYEFDIYTDTEGAGPIHFSITVPGETTPAPEEPTAAPSTETPGGNTPTPEEPTTAPATETPAGTEGPTGTETPAVTESPAATESPAVSEAPSTEQPVESQEPTESQKPGVDYYKAILKVTGGKATLSGPGVKETAQTAAEEAVGLEWFQGQVSQDYTDGVHNIVEKEGKTGVHEVGRNIYGVLSEAISTGVVTFDGDVYLGPDEPGIRVQVENSSAVAYQNENPGIIAQNIIATGSGTSVTSVENAGWYHIAVVVDYSAETPVITGTLTAPDGTNLIDNVPAALEGTATDTAVKQIRLVSRGNIDSGEYSYFANLSVKHDGEEIATPTVPPQASEAPSEPDGVVYEILENSEVTVNTTPDTEGQVPSITVKTADGYDVPVTDSKFTMPSKDVDVDVKFGDEEPGSSTEPGTSAEPESSGEPTTAPSTEAPAGTEGPTGTETPAVTESPAATESPAVSEAPSTEQPVESQEPTESQKPGVDYYKAILKVTGGKATLSGPGVKETAQTAAEEAVGLEWFQGQVSQDYTDGVHNIVEKEGKTGVHEVGRNIYGVLSEAISTGVVTFDGDVYLGPNETGFRVQVENSSAGAYQNGNLGIIAQNIIATGSGTSVTSVENAGWYHIAVVVDYSAETPVITGTLTAPDGTNLIDNVPAALEDAVTDTAVKQIRLVSRGNVDSGEYSYFANLSVKHDGEEIATPTIPPQASEAPSESSAPETSEAPSEPEEVVYEILENSEVTVNTTPDTEGQVPSITVKTADGYDIPVTDSKFTMPSKDVNVDVKFVDIPVEPSENPQASENPDLVIYRADDPAFDEYAKSQEDRDGETINGLTIGNKYHMGKNSVKYEHTDGTVYNFERAWVGGTGAVGGDRSLSFDVKGDCIVTVVFDGNNNAGRTQNIAFNGKTVATGSSVASGVVALTADIVGAGTVCTWGGSSNKRVYAILVEYIEPESQEDYAKVWDFQQVNYGKEEAEADGLVYSGGVGDQKNDGSNGKGFLTMGDGGVVKIPADLDILTENRLGIFKITYNWDTDFDIEGIRSYSQVQGGDGYAEYVYYSAEDVDADGYVDLNGHGTTYIKKIERTSSIKRAVSGTVSTTSQKDFSNAVITFTNTKTGNVVRIPYGKEYTVDTLLRGYEYEIAIEGVENVCATIDTMNLTVYKDNPPHDIVFVDLAETKTVGDVVVHKVYNDSPDLDLSKVSFTFTATDDPTVVYTVAAGEIADGKYEKVMMPNHEYDITATGIDGYELSSMSKTFMMKAGDTAPFKNILIKEVIKAEEFPTDGVITVGPNGKFSKINDAIDAIQLMTNRANGEDGRAYITLESGQVYTEQVIIDTDYVTIKAEDNAAEMPEIHWYYGIGYIYYSAGNDQYYSEDAAVAKTEKKPVTRWGCAIRVLGNRVLMEGVKAVNTFNCEVTPEELADGVEAAGEGVYGDVAGKPDRTVEGYDAMSKPATERAAAIAIDANNFEAYKCEFISSQDTFYTNTSYSYIKDCYIEGGTDYIYGGRRIVFDNCTLAWHGYSDVSTGGYLTACSDGGDEYGYLFKDCTVTNSKYFPTNKFNKGSWGRNWGGASCHVVYDNMKLDGVDVPGAWVKMSGDLSASTLYILSVTDKNGKAVDVSGKDFNPNGTAEANGYTVHEMYDYFGTWTPPHYDGPAKPTPTPRPEGVIDVNIDFTNTDIYTGTAKNSPLSEATIAELAEQGVTLDPGTIYWNNHGCSGLGYVTIDAKGPYKITIGACEFGPDEAQLLKGEEVLAKVNLKSQGGDTGKYDMYYGGTEKTPITLKFSAASYVHSISIVTVDPSEVPDVSNQATITYSLGSEEGVAGTVPDEVTANKGENITIPVNQTLYKEGSTLTGWTDGSKSYAPGSEYTVSDNATLTPVFTAITDSTPVGSVSFKIAKADSKIAISVGEGSKGILVTQAKNAAGESIDVKLDIDCTNNGKLNNGNNGNDWAQINLNTILTFPVANNATIATKMYSGTSYTIDGVADVAAGTGKEQVYTYTGEGPTTKLMITGENGYISYITVTYPAN